MFVFEAKEAKQGHMYAIGRVVVGRGEGAWCEGKEATGMYNLLWRQWFCGCPSALAFAEPGRKGTGQSFNLTCPEVSHHVFTYWTSTYVLPKDKTSGLYQALGGGNKQWLKYKFYAQGTHSLMQSLPWGVCKPGSTQRELLKSREKNIRSLNIANFSFWYSSKVGL